MTLKACLKSMRLRTLPLSLAGIVTGTALASTVAKPSFLTVMTLALTTVLLQILSNLSNELGDTLHGTDTGERQGIHYSLQDGEMTVAQMKSLIGIIAVLCCASGLAMVLLSFKSLFSVPSIALLALGAAAIWAAMHYTLGKNPYGYRGLGDLFVFIFFGLVAVLGAGFVCAHCFRWIWVLPASAIGCWSIGVLNVNNIRDMKTDAATRTTVALKLGLKNARVYQSVLIAAGWALMLGFNLAFAWHWSQWIHFVTLPLFALHIKAVWTKEDRALDPVLPMLVMASFATSILFALGI